jgi:surface antigen
MTSLFLFKASSSLNRLLIVAFSAMALILCLPILAVLSITNASALSQAGITLYNGPAYPGDEYAFGNCTYWVALRRAQIGEPIPNTWGNAATWAINAILDGYKVDHQPSYGAIMQTPNAAGGLGHVAFVEAIEANGEWQISEMNVVGFDEVDNKTLPLSAAISYSFIHENLN